jgi:HlyD family secretion protein
MSEQANNEDQVMEKLGLAAAVGTGRRYKQMGVILGFGLIIGIFIMLFTAKESASIGYSTAPVRQGDLIVTISATGNLYPTNQVDVGSELSGIVKSVLVTYNDHVTAGQMLAILDTEKLTARARQSRASLEVARASVGQIEASLAEAQAKYDKLKNANDLSGGRIPSRDELDSAKTAVTRAQANLRGAQAQVVVAMATLSSDETDLAKTKVRSPIDGIVLDRNIEPGQTVASSLQAPVLFTLAEDLTKLELRISVDEADIGQMKESLEATFSVDAFPGKHFPAQVTQVRLGSQISSGVVTYRTILSVDNPERLLRPGMTATAEIVVEKLMDRILVPNAALRFKPLTTVGSQKGDAGQSTSLLGRIMPRPPMSPSTKRSEETVASGDSRQVWTLRQGIPTPLSVIAGATNGSVTVVNEGDLRPGMELIVGTVRTQS